MLNTKQAKEASANNIYPPASLDRAERHEMISIYNAEMQRISAEWREWLAHTHFPQEAVGSVLEIMVWTKVCNDAEASVRNSRWDIEANYKELTALVNVARGNCISQ